MKNVEPTHSQQQQNKKKCLNLVFDLEGKFEFRKREKVLK